MDLKQILKPDQTLVVVGGNWGDEGKGKVIDLLMANFDATVRFSGGANAGHTVFTPEGKKLISSLIPCGVAQNKTCVLARGEFFNLELFFKELESSKAIVGQVPEILIDEQAPLWTPYHRFFEMYIEAIRGSKALGTTNKGIGPMAGIYILRLAPVVGYLFEPELLKTSLKALYDTLKPCLEYLKSSQDFKEEIPDFEKVAEELLFYSARVKEYVTDTSLWLDSQLKEGKKLLFEGAQAVGLDAWWGTYPYVSSGISSPVGASLGTGLPMSVFTSTVVVAKVLPTRVGNGPMPSEMWQRQAAMDFARDHKELFVKGETRNKFLSAALEKINSGNASHPEMSQYFQVLGDERGAITGRGRSVGFLDIPWLSYVVRITKPKYLALTRFDMLSGLKETPVIVGYEHDGKKLPAGSLPPSWKLKDVKPIFENWPCWQENIFGYNDFAKLPKPAQDFITRIEKLLAIPILLIGTGPGRDAMIVKS